MRDKYTKSSNEISFFVCLSSDIVFCCFCNVVAVVTIVTVVTLTKYIEQNKVGACIYTYYVGIRHQNKVESLQFF